MNINVLGIDLAKSIFQLCGVDNHGKIVKESTVKRAQLLTQVKKLSPQVIAMEASGSANYWAREFAGLGVTVRLIPPQYVKPFVKGKQE